MRSRHNYTYRYVTEVSTTLELDKKMGYFFVQFLH
jgi:hypothetical protein